MHNNILVGDKAFPIYESGFWSRIRNLFMWSKFVQFRDYEQFAGFIMMVELVSEFECCRISIWRYLLWKMGFLTRPLNRRENVYTDVKMKFRVHWPDGDEEIARIKIRLYEYQAFLDRYNRDYVLRARARHARDVERIGALIRQNWPSWRRSGLSEIKLDWKKLGF